MKDTLLAIKNNALSLILETNSAQELEELRIQLLGRNGSLTQALKELAKLPKEEKPEAGKVANEVKTIIEQAFRERAHAFSKKKRPIHSDLDVTDPGIRPTLGHLHLVTQAIKEITAIFEHIGYTRVRYPEIEWDWYAFTSLNFPDNHPARDDWETFFVKHKAHPEKGPVVLTPHTSSGQVREMERHIKHLLKGHPGGRLTRPIGSHKNDSIAMLQNDKNSKTVSDFDIRASNLSIKMLNIAKCYRRQSDVSHTPAFHQFEGLVVGENIAISDLKGTLDYFVKSYFGPDRSVRIRPYHFQFTEPSFEIDISCGVCKGSGYVNVNTPAIISNEVRNLGNPEKRTREACRLCKAGWLEIGGAGMVHPNVLRAGGIDPEKYTGFAFGWGVERVLMMKEGIEIADLRMLYNNDLDFLQQF